MMQRIYTQGYAGLPGMSAGRLADMMLSIQGGMVRSKMGMLTLITLMLNDILFAPPWWGLVPLKMGRSLLRNARQRTCLLPRYPGAS